MAGLTKQHFKKIAEIINKEVVINRFETSSLEMNKEIESVLKVLIEGLSNYFKIQNPLFDENRFKKACLE